MNYPERQDESLEIEPKNTPLDWRARFDREDHLFRPSEQVKVPAHVKNIEGAIMLVADDQDGRMADRFFLPAETPQETLDILEQYRGIAVTYVVTILNVIDRGYQLSDIHEYNVRLEPNIDLPPVNPDEEMVSKLPRGTRVTIEGKLIRIELRDTINDRGHKTKSPYSIIETDDGRQLAIPHWEGLGLQYSGGVLENLNGKFPKIGEKIRLTAYIREQQGHKVMHAQYSYFHLLEASAERLADYQNLRKTVAEEINQLRTFIQSGQYKEARTLFANIRKRELTKNETATILGAFPQEEKPIMSKDKYRINRLNTAFGIMVESMTKEEFLEFAMAVSSGRKIPVGKECDTSYVYDILKENGYDDGIVCGVLTETIDERLARLEKASDESSSASHSDSWMIEMSLRHLADVQSPAGIRKILEIARYCVQNGYYMQQRDVGAGWTPRCKFSNLLDEATHALKRLIEKYPNTIDILKRDAAEISSWARALTQNCLSRHVIEYINAISASITALPPHAEPAALPSPEDPMEKIMAEITEGLNEEEKQAVTKGLKEGMEAMMDKLSILEASGENVAGCILQGFAEGMKATHIQTELHRQRQSGTSAQWLEQQIRISIIEAVNIHWRKQRGPIDIISTVN